MPHVFQGEARPFPGKIAIVVARFNESITSNLLRGALETLAESGVSDDQVLVAWVPGAWEVPMAAKRMLRKSDVRAVIALAAVIRGETTHDQYINQQVSHSLGQLACDTEIPVLFGVLTCQTVEQAIHRSGGLVGNKGSDCAVAALQMIDLLAKLD